MLIINCILTSIGFIFTAERNVNTIHHTTIAQSSTNNESYGNNDHHNRSRVMVIDSIIYKNDPLLLFRLAVLQHKVDRFYIFKANCTISDQSDWQQNTDHDEINPKHFESFDKKIRWLYGPCDAREREKVRATSVHDAAQDDLNNNIISHPFVIVNSDINEIIDPNDLEELNPGGKYHQLALNTTIMLNMESFICNLNWKRKLRKKVAHILPGRKVVDGWININSLYENSKARLAAASIDSGYHLEDFSHQCKRISNHGESGDIEHWSYKQAPLPLQQLHEYICEMQAVDPLTGIKSNDVTSSPLNLDHFMMNLTKNKKNDLP